MLTFPADKSDFSAPNGVTYAWDGTDGKWRVKAFRSIDDFIVQLQDQAPAADESKVGDLWFDTSDESLTLFVYTGGEWVPAAPPVSLDGINATIDAALIVQNDLLARVESGEIVQTGVLDDLTTLQHKVEALEGTVIDGKWYAESRSNPREGGFDITSGGLQSMGDWSADFLRVHKTDSTGKAFTFAEVSTGDYIRIGAPGSTAVYKINEVVSGSLDWQAFSVELANSTGTPIPDLTYDFEFLPSFDPSAYATIQYVDAQDDLDVKLAAVNDVSIGFRIKNGGNTLISTATEGELGLYHVKDPSDGNEGWAANKGYVDDNFINIAGQTDLDSQVFKIRQPNSEGAFRSFINIHNGDMNLYNVVDPSGAGHERWAATKGYVDDQIAAIPSVDLDDYLPLVGGDMTGRIDITVSDPSNAAIRTIGSINVKSDGQQLGQANNFIAHKDYVRVYSTPSGPQDVVNKEYAEGHFAEKSHTHDYKKAALWKAVSTSTAAGDLQVGEFFVADNNNIYLHSKSANGIDLGISGNTEYSQSMTYIASIFGRGTYNSLYSTVADKINLNVSNNNYVRVQSSHLLYKQGFSVGTQYVINIPGFTP